MASSKLVGILSNFTNVQHFGSYLNVPTVTGNNTNLTCPAFDWYNGTNSWSPFADDVWWNPAVGLWGLFIILFLGGIVFAFMNRHKLKIYKMLTFFGVSMILDYLLIVGLVYVPSTAAWYMGTISGCARSIFLYFALGWISQLLKDYSTLTLFGPTVGIPMTTDIMHKKLTVADDIVANTPDKTYSSFDVDHDMVRGEAQYYLRDIIMIWGFLTYLAAAFVSLQAISAIWQNWGFSLMTVSWGFYIVTHIVLFVLHLPSYKQTAFKCGKERTGREYMQHGVLPWVNLVFVLFNATLFSVRIYMTSYYVPTEDPFRQIATGAVPWTVQQQAQTIGILAFIQLWVFLVYAVILTFSYSFSFCNNVYSKVKKAKGYTQQNEGDAESVPMADYTGVPLDAQNAHGGEKPHKPKKPRRS